MNAVELAKELRPGDAIRLVKMPGEPEPLPLGIEGRVIAAYPYESYAFIKVAWEDGRTLSLICPPDDFEIA